MDEARLGRCSWLVDGSLPPCLMVRTASAVQRSAVMALVKSKGNRSTELVFVRLLRSARISGWRRHADLIGRPDFAFRTERVVVFLDGCFWHGCPRCYRAPATNRRYWATKVASNVARDRRQRERLRRLGWSVMRIWEHSLRLPDAVLSRLRRAGLKPRSA
jgi:DNA mismatch endonuclease (patch repair protein)